MSPQIFRRLGSLRILQKLLPLKELRLRFSHTGVQYLRRCVRPDTAAAQFTLRRELEPSPGTQYNHFDPSEQTPVCKTAEMSTPVNLSKPGRTLHIGVILMNGYNPPIFILPSAPKT